MITGRQANGIEVLREKLLLLERDFRGTLGQIAEYTELLFEERNEVDMECLCLHIDQLKDEYDEAERIAAKIRQYESTAGRKDYELRRGAHYRR